MDIFKRDLSGESISINDSEFYKIKRIINEAQKILAKLNLSYHTREEVNRIFSRLTGRDVDPSFELLPPFYTDFGRNIKIGKNVFINQNCTFLDRGGIQIEDRALIGPKVNLITTNHTIEPAKRRNTESFPIYIGRNVWVGAGATITPGVTVGENAVIAAGAVVTRDVPPNTIVGGIPARVLKNIEHRKETLQ